MMLPPEAPRSFVAGEQDAGARLDALIARNAGISRALAARLIAEGAVVVDDAPASKSLRVEAGMRIDVVLPGAREAPGPEDIPLRVVYEDAWLLVLSKPAGLVVHPAPGHAGGTVVNALLARARRPAGGAADRPGIVHRLDAGTSGLMIVALDAGAHERLTAAMAERAVHRTYIALVEGSPDTDTATIDAPVGRSERHRKRMAVVATGKPAVTRYRVLERLARASLLEVEPETGRTHQIRVHLSATGHPVLGDRVYGRDRALARALGLERPFLHAARLVFDHPVTSERVEISDDLPEDLQAALERARA